MTTERDLIEQSRKGDAEAFTRLIDRYEDRIFRLAKHVCVGMSADADDVYLETFLTAFKKLKSFRGDSELGTWLYRNFDPGRLSIRRSPPPREDRWAVGGATSAASARLAGRPVRCTEFVVRRAHSHGGAGLGLLFHRAAPHARVCGKN